MGKEARGLFGYVRPHIPELLVKEHSYYKAVYCGLCRAMRAEAGRLSTLSLSYDFVFLALVRFAVDQPALSTVRRRCIAHPLRRRPMLAPNPVLARAARLSATLTYHQLRDDLRDRGMKRKLRAVLLYPIFRRAHRRVGEGECESEIRRCLDTLARIERERIASVDLAADAFGNLLAAVFADGAEPKYRPLLAEIGKHLGRFIYAADAAEDFARDRRSGSYNPYVLAYGEAELDRKTVYLALKLELTALSRAIDLLPFREMGAVRAILENILYYGLPERISFLSDEAKQKGEST
jgi:hypothetical protein